MNAETLYRDALIQGQRACAQGTLPGDNPYPVGSAQFKGWRDGYRLAERGGRFNVTGGGRWWTSRIAPTPREPPGAGA